MKREAFHWQLVKSLPEGMGYMEYIDSTSGSWSWNGYGSGGPSIPMPNLVAVGAATNRLH